MRLRGYGFILYLVIMLVFVFWLSSLRAQEYSRDLFPHWCDLDGDGQDTRVEVLIASAIPLKQVKGYINSQGDSIIVSGLWFCVYTGQLMGLAEDIDIDHLVPLKWAWEHGADKWTEEKRRQFANDPMNVVAVSSSANRSKGAKGPEEWLPSALMYVELYIKAFMEVCDKYELEYDIDLYVERMNDFMPHSNGIKVDKLTMSL